jgi:hypothetical protein
MQARVAMLGQSRWYSVCRPTGAAYANAQGERQSFDPSLSKK